MKNYFTTGIKKSIISGWLFMATLSASFAYPAEKIWIDTDIAIGKFGKDVDDGIALIMALRSEQLQIEGISLVSNVDYGYEITQRLLNWYHQGAKIPVYKGTPSAKQSNQANEAVEALAQALQKNKLTIIALGPATNIAILLQQYPELATQIKRIVWCAGRQPDQHFSPGLGLLNVCDCNFDKDPQSGQVILSSGIEITLAGYEPASHIYISKKDLEPLKNSDGEADQWLYQQLMNWLNLWRFGLGSTQGFIPFDAITLGSFSEKEYMRYYKDIPVQVKILKNDARFWSFQSQKSYLLASASFNTEQTADYFYSTDEDFKKVILKALLPQNRENFQAHK